MLVFNMTSSMTWTTPWVDVKSALITLAPPNMIPPKFKHPKMENLLESIYQTQGVQKWISLKILTGRYTNVNSTARKNWNRTICESSTVDSAENSVIVNHFDQKLIRMGKIITKKGMWKAFECRISRCKQREWSGYEREWNKMSNWHLKILQFFSNSNYLFLWRRIRHQ